MREIATKVLVVEHNDEHAAAIEESLAGSVGDRFALTRARSLAEARQHLDDRSLDLALIDLSLPDASGFDAFAELVAHSRNIPVVVLTEVDDDDLGRRAVQAGAQDFLCKHRVDAHQLARSLLHAVERHRLIREQAEQAAVSSALARVGEELISSLNTHVLVERLCRLTGEVLEGDFTHTWLWDEEDEVYVPVAHHGDPPAMWDLVRGLRLPHDMVQGFLSQLEVDGIFYSVISDASPLVRAGIDIRQSGIEAVLYIVVRRGRQVIGAQACGYSRADKFRPHHEQIAKGLVHLASLGLANARLVEKLENSNLVKTYLAATMSHELRGTLGTVFLGADDLLRAPSIDLGEDVRQTLEIVRQQARESADLIEATLEMYAAEIKGQGTAEGVVLEELLDEVVRETSVVSQKSAVKIEQVIEPDLPILHTDATKLKMILKNLIGNALKYSDHGVVRVSAHHGDRRMEIRVRDSGVGIPASDLPTIFEPFRQVHGERSRSGGFGLGLYIVRRLVDMLGGSIRAESELGVGSTFFVSIPASPPLAGGLSVGSPSEQVG